MQNFERRVATHYLLARAVLEVTAADPVGLQDRVAAARAESAADRSDLIITHEAGERDIDLPLIDAESGAPMPTPVRLIDSRDLRPVDVRARPAGYLVLRGAADVAERLGLNEVSVREVAADGELAVEAYEVERTESRKGRNAINPDQLVRVEIRCRTIAVPAGALFVPMAQPAAGIAAAALEPDSPGSYVGCRSHSHGSRRDRGAGLSGDGRLGARVALRAIAEGDPAVTRRRLAGQRGVSAHPRLER